MRDIITTADGRALECWVTGPAGAPALLFVTGTPSSGEHFTVVGDAAAELGWRTVSFARPGYAASTAQPGRTVADFAADATAVLDWAGAGTFVVAGWSGGGPHALACAALLAPRCQAAAVIAGVAPHPAAGIDWLAGMGAENLDEFAAAFAGSAAIEAYLTPQVSGMAALTGADLGVALGDLAPAADVAVLTGAFADELAASFRGAVSTGVAGWRDDDLAFVGPWGFDLAEISVPVTIWQGGVDRMVPAAHGSWLAAAIAHARLVRLPEDGHITPIANRLPQILGELVASIGTG